jgi:hypothetical protein
MNDGLKPICFKYNGVYSSKIQTLGRKRKKAKPMATPCTVSDNIYFTIA